MPASAGHAAAAVTTTDSDLVKELRERRPAAFAHLYSLYQSRLLRHLCGRTLDRGLAEDVTHDALLRAADRIDAFDPARPLWPWLKRIADNLLIDALRRTVRVDVTDDFTDVAMENDRTAQADERALMKAALNHLPLRQQTALTLSYVHGLSATQAAGMLGISRNAFDQLLHRARAGLRTRYLSLEPEAATQLRTVLLPTLLEWGRRSRGRLASIANHAGAHLTAAASAVDMIIPALLITTALAAPQSAAGEPASPHAVDPRPGLERHEPVLSKVTEQHRPHRPRQAHPSRQQRVPVTSYTPAEDSATGNSTRSPGHAAPAMDESGNGSVQPSSAPVQVSGSHRLTSDESKVHASGDVEGSAAEKEPQAHQWVEFPCDTPTREKVCQTADLPDQLPAPPEPPPPPAEADTP